MDRNDTSFISQPEFNGVSSVWQRFTRQGISSPSSDILMAAWHDSTKKQYNTYIKKWLKYCSINDCDPFSPSTANALDFLMFLYNKGLSYSTINTARSALSCFCNFEGLPAQFGQLPIVEHFMKGVFQLRPSIPKHHSIWDVKQIFDFFALSHKLMSYP